MNMHIIYPPKLHATVILSSATHKKAPLTHANSTFCMPRERGDLYSLGHIDVGAGATAVGDAVAQSNL